MTTDISEFDPGWIADTTDELNALPANSIDGVYPYADLGITIVRDDREKEEYTFDGSGIEVVVRRRETGDYGIDGHENLGAVERKNPRDVTRSMTRTRQNYQAEQKRAEAFAEPLLNVIEAPRRYYESGEHQKGYGKGMGISQFFGTIDNWSEHYNAEFCFNENREEAERRTLRYLLELANKHIDGVNADLRWVDVY